MNPVIKTRSNIILALVMAGLLALFTSSAIKAATTSTVVTALSADWAFVNDNGTTGDWTTGFENGPGTAPLGTGSAFIHLNSAGAGVYLGTQKYPGIRLSTITTLTYSTYTNLSPAALAFQINYDPDLTAGGTRPFFGRLIYEPYRNGTVTNGTWQTWDMINGGAGKWWASSNAYSTVDDTCSQSSPCTLSYIITHFPNIGIRNDAGAGILFKAGANWNGFAGNVDNLTIGIGSNSDTYDFEPETPCMTTCYVNGATGSDALGGDTPATAKKTIQAAVTQVSSGGQVIVAAGAYNENVTIGKSLTLNGAGAGSDPAVHTIINGSSLTGRGIFIQSNVTNVTILNLRVQNFTGTNGGGIYANGGNHNFTVRNTDVFTNGVALASTGGIYMNGPVNNVVADNVRAYYNLSRGIVIWNGFKTNITLTNNDVRYNNCCGIELQDGTASGVVISGNTVIGNADSGMAAIGLMAGAGPNLIANNTLQNNGRFGIEIKLPNGTGLESGDGSIVVANNVVGLTAPMGTLKPSEQRDLAGISVYRRGWVAGNNNVDIPTGVVVKNNTVSGYLQNATGSVSTGFGIVVEGTGMKVYSNTVSNNDVGIQWQAGHLPYTPNSNLDGDQSNVTDLYFGRGNSPVVCASVSGNTFSGNGINQRGVPGTLGTASVTNVDTGRSYCSIQSAIDAPTTLNGHTISVGAGTYIENITITKQLTLLGPNANLDPNTTPRQPEAVIVPKVGGVSNNVSGQFIINLDAQGVVINGFTLDGDNPALNTGNVFNGSDVDVDFGIVNNHFDAILPNLDADISYNVVKNINDFGVWFSSNDTGTTNNTISHNQVDNILGTYGQGIRLADNAFGNVTHNVVTRVRNAIVIENFSSNSAGTVSTVSDNTLTALRRGIRFNLHYNYPTGGFTLSDNQIASYVQTLPVPQNLSTLWVGIEVESIHQPVPVTVTRNSVAGNLAALNSNGYTSVYGTRITNSYATSPYIDIVSNTLSDAGVGLLNEAPADVLVHQNTFTANDIGVSATAGGLRLISNTLSSNPIGVQVQAGSAITLAGNTLVTQTTALSQTGGTLIAYANNITNFTTGFNHTGGTYNIRHNWWGKYKDPAPTGVDDTSWQARLGAAVGTWSDGVNSTALLTATLSGGTGTAVIVSHGHNAANAPFGNGIEPYVSHMCSDFYDFFTVDGGGDWTVNVPVDNTAACNSQTLTPKKLYWIAAGIDYASKCLPNTNKACWTLPPTVTPGIQALQVSGLTAAQLGGTPFVAGSTTGTNPTTVNLASFTAVKASDHISVAWETTNELHNLGFNLWRSTALGNPPIQLNTNLIPSQAPGGTEGFAYTYEDQNVVNGTTYYYWLDDVDLSGTVTRHGPVSSAMTGVSPSAVRLISLTAVPSVMFPAAWLLLGVGVIGLAGAVRMRSTRKR